MVRKLIIVDQLSHTSVLSNGIGVVILQMPQHSEVLLTKDNVEDLPDDEDDLDDGVVEEGAQQPAPGGALTLRGLLMKVKRTVRFFKQSEVAASRLKELQKVEQGKKDGQCLRLIQEVKTRWNSCFEMLQRYLLLAPLVVRVVLDLQRQRISRAPAPDIISPAEEEILKEVKDLLAPLHRATQEVSSEKLVTLSKCIPVINSLRTEIEKYSATKTISKQVKEILKALLKDAFDSIELVPMYAAATLLGPRFKKFGFRQDLTTPRRVGNAISFVGDLVKKKMRAAEVQAQAEQALEREENPAAQEPTEPDDFWSSLDQQVEQQSSLHSGQDVAGGIPVQLRAYLDSPPVKRKDYPNPLIAWEPLKGELRHVYAVAQEYLSILANSVPSERLFSHAGMISNQKRTRLAAKRLEMLVFLRSCDDDLWFD
ncbi:zinc finger BED domain-containing protein 4-like [Frankliniella occidentalis]|uniref:Zinc finger BED domain-containing protein 4-like n=1 Tax=Frankliniella occidentalis TaxID=133901 RepID=A0A9C6XSW7_FRAOC|nr:zinc finger BED domain-containing protein 4-like [Frankliniella occidentalis]